MTSGRVLALLCCALCGGCGGGEVGAPDAEPADVGLEDARGDHAEGAVATDVVPDDRVSIDAGVDSATPILDASGEDQGVLLRDVGALEVGTTDVGQPDARPSDASALDAGRADAPAADVPADARDATASDDGRALVDAGTSDASVADVRTADVASDVPRDAPIVDVGCTGPGPLVTVVAPTNGEAIETCSAAGAPVYFDFAAGVSGSAPVLALSARWITPDNVEAPPPAMRPAAPYVFRRQVGGPSAGAPALSVFGLRGVWRVEFTAVDSCGRRTTTSQSFSLVFTPRRCPNP